MFRASKLHVERVVECWLSWPCDTFVRHCITISWTPISPQVLTLPLWHEMFPTVIQSAPKNGQPTSHGPMMEPRMKATVMKKMMKTGTPDKHSDLPFQSHRVRQQPIHGLHPQSHLLASTQKYQNLHGMAMTQKHIFLRSRTKLPYYVKKTPNLLPMPS